MPTYTASNGSIISDLATLIAIPSTSLPSSGFAVLFVASENSWYEYNPALTSGDVTPTNNPTNGRWLRIGRDKLTANRIYYVRTDGSNSNNGLTNTSGGAFLTWAKCQDVLAGLDGNGYSVTVQFTGTFTTGISIDKQFIGFSFIQIDGNTTTPANSFINTSGTCVFVSTNTPIYIKGLKLASSSLIGLFIGVGTCEVNGNIDFGVCSFSHIYVSGQKAQLSIRSGYLISGQSNTHIQIYDQGFIDSNSSSTTVTISGSPAFSGGFILASRGGTGLFVSTTYSGAATGVRYAVGALSGLWVVSTTFAGSIAGTTDAKGYYGA